MTNNFTFAGKSSLDFVDDEDELEVGDESGDVDPSGTCLKNVHERLDDTL